MFRECRTRAFSLPDLLGALVVVAGVGLGAPTFVPRDPGRLARVCESNQKQVMLATERYLQDHEGLWPGYWGTMPHQNQHLNFWNDRLYRGYLPSEASLGCPAAKATLREKRLEDPADLTARPAWSLHATYGARGDRRRARNYLQGPNYFNVWALETTGYEPFRREVTASGDYWMFADSAWGNQAGRVNLDRQDSVLSANYRGTNVQHAAVATRHRDRALIAFADGHVERVAAAQLSERLPLESYADGRTGRVEPVPAR